MKILITNTVALNVGDAAILKGILKIFESIFKSDTTYFIYDSQPSIVQKYYPKLNFRQLIYFQTLYQIKGIRRSLIIQKIDRNRLYKGISIWSKGLKLIANIILTKKEIATLKDYQTADLIVSTGGTYLVENYDIECRILDYKMSMMLQKKLIFYTQSLGPFTTKKNQERCKEIFNYASIILLRDQLSKKHLVDLGVDESKIYLTADAAFALADLTSINSALLNTGKISENARIAISVRNWPHFKSIDPILGQKKYLDSLQILTEYLVKKHKAKITFISTCQGIPEYYIDDSKVAQIIFDNLSYETKEFVNVNSSYHSPEDLAELLKSFDFVIATRLHMSILALGVGVPVFPIAYEFKTAELFRKINLDHYMVDIETIHSESLIESVEIFIDQLPTIREKIAIAVKKEYNSVFESGLLIRNLLET